MNKTGLFLKSSWSGKGGESYTETIINKGKHHNHKKGAKKYEKTEEGDTIST